MAVVHPMLAGRLWTRITTPRHTTTTTTIAPLEPIIDIMDPDNVEKLPEAMHKCLSNAGIVHSKLVPGQVFDVNGSWCARIYDGYSWWNRAPGGTISTQLCPSLFVGYKTQVAVYKECSINGTWQGSPGSNSTSTDYTACMNGVADLNFRTNVNHIYVTGYSVSVAALLLSLALFAFFRKLACTRIRIHVNLFSSMILNNVLRILWYKLVIDEVTVVQNNKMWCQILHVLVNYFMVTTHFWMFVEALYLHMSLTWVFVRNKVLWWFKAIGWWIPLVVVMAYAIVRYIYGYVDRCWMENSDTFWIITVPVLISLLSSFAILVNVVRVIITKLQQQSGHVSNRIVKAKKGACAAVFLMPLFGLHFLLIPLRPNPGSSFEVVYEVLSALLTSLQGLCVSFWYCFEVTTAVKALWARICNRNGRTDDIPMTGTTAARIDDNHIRRVYEKNVVRGYRHSSSFD